MSPTQRYRELIADHESHCAGLGESQVVGVSRASCANQTRLRSYEFEVGLVAEPPRFADRQDALVDLAGSGIDLDECSLMPRQSRIGLVLAKRTLSRAPAELGLFWQLHPHSTGIQFQASPLLPASLMLGFKAHTTRVGAW